MAEDIDDGKSVQLGEFGIFRPTIKAKSADTAEGVTAVAEVRAVATKVVTAVWMKIH